MHSCNPWRLLTRAVHAVCRPGYEKLESAICVKDEASLEKFMDLEFVLGTDVMLQLRKCPATAAAAA
jgi:hypothetical protein